MPDELFEDAPLNDHPEAVALWRRYADLEGEDQQVAADSIYDEVVAEVAKDLQLPEGELRGKFSRYLYLPYPDNGGEEWAACYAVYRLTKAYSAFRMATRSRNGWRERAMDLGSPGHLR